ncbi:MAG: prepilin-type N-terminal cleavage/methylation domain-containing protein [Candidatus Hydrothermia bacterium]
MKRKGFTLIELLIVIAIIAILAAIAIPQFSRYRVRAYNGAAESDLRNARTTYEAFFADWQHYPGTVAADSGNVGIAWGGHEDTFSLSTGVYFGSNTDEGGNVSYTMGTHHVQGDTEYGGDSDVQGIYYQRDKGYIGEVGLPEDIPESNPQEDDFAGGGWILQ